MAASQAVMQHRTLAKRLSSRATRKAAAFYLLIAPWLLGCVFLSIFPIIVGILTSLTNYDGLNIDTITDVRQYPFARDSGTMMIPTTAPVTPPTGAGPMVPGTTTVPPPVY